jgi:hypothetical protein
LFPSQFIAALDGTFASPEFPAGRYRFTVRVPSGWHVVSVISDGQDLAGLPFDLDRHLRDVVVTISTRGARVSGNVKSEANGAPGARVIIFSADPRHWMQLSPYDRRLQEAMTGRDGRYALADLPAGEYLILAGTIELVDWERPNLLESLSKLATRVTLAEGETRSLDLRVVGSK